ncbi:hypothetical protein CPB84DRAFT_1824809 [Gymnopilus junonius]|uniref:Uncharacterized protein n=1 Tax=Gymnopilus junonius TaxID=109634 RepID=A0A9P5NN63_GYMJU|nr:hypothetical protein CPB84DRAFT_1824809 [Gymnopilus junonius]
MDNKHKLGKPQGLQFKGITQKMGGLRVLNLSNEVLLSWIRKIKKQESKTTRGRIGSGYQGTNSGFCLSLTPIQPDSESYELSITIISSLRAWRREKKTANLWVESALEARRSVTAPKAPYGVVVHKCTIGIQAFRDDVFHQARTSKHRTTSQKSQAVERREPGARRMRVASVESEYWY